MPIQKADMTAAGALAELIRAAFSDVARRFGLTPENTPRHPSNCTEEWVADAMEKGVSYYQMDSDGTLCGCVALERAGDDVFYLERLAVLPSFRRRGLGRALVAHACLKAQAAGATRLEIGIIDAQSELKSWYVRSGFEQTRTAEYAHLPFTVCFMKRELR
ncbi:MAG: GNAT family N-acetyltransferase [Desulfobacterales bacterium]|nr:GNAT family N-acetyltransferase [Desulfobacterales bacterium]